MYGNITSNELLQRLEKAVHSGNITEIVPEDLELEAHSVLWRESDQGELTLLKMLPSVKATSIQHEYSRVLSYGPGKGSGFFGERSLPAESNFAAQRVVNLIRLMGEIGPTFLLAALEKTQRALGTAGAQNVERIALRRNVLRKKCRNLYASDTSTTFGGVNSTRFKGIQQLIREGTDGTNPGDPPAPYGTHIIDMLDQPLTIQNLRDRIGKGITLFGAFTSLITDPLVRGDLEASMDPAQRLNLPIDARPFMLGQQIGGIQSQGSRVYFETDNTLSPIWYRPQYDVALEDGAPTTLPTVVSAAQADNATTDTTTSKWDAASAGAIFYVVTEVVQEKEGLGTRSPAGAGTLAVLAGQEVELTITPGNVLADSFRVYRGEATGGLLSTDAWFAFEVAGNHVGVVTAFDNNLRRPNTSEAYGLRVLSGSERAMHNGMVDAYWRAQDSSASFLSGNDKPGNTIAVAELGPSMGIMALASILAEVDRPLVYSACCPEVRNPRQNVVFTNIGLQT